MKPTDQIYPFFEWNEPGFGDSITVIDRDGGKQWFPFNRGMDLRTYLAGQAMQGILAHSNMSFVDDAGRETKVIKPETVARFSVRMADALIEELNKEKK